MEASFNELRQKDVINVCSGRRMGKLTDLIFSTRSKEVLGIVLPAERKLFGKHEDIFIPWCNIEKIGEDVILVSIDLTGCRNIVKNTDKRQSGGVTSENDYLVT